MPLTISHAKSDTIADFTGTVTVNNSSGGTTTAVATDLVRPSDWNSNHQYTISLTASELASIFNFGTGLTSSTAGGGISVGMASDPWFEPFPFYNTNSTITAPGIGTWYLDGPYEVDQAIGSGQINCLVTNAAGFVGTNSYSASSSGAVTVNQTLYHQLALYQQGTGASTSRLESKWTMLISFLATHQMALSTANTSSGSVTNQLTLSFPSQWDTAGGVTYGSTSASGTSNMTASTMASTRYDSLVSAAAAFVTGARMDIFGLSSTFGPGIYWLAHMFTSTSSSTGTSGGLPVPRLFSTQSRLGIIEVSLGNYKQLGKNTSNSSTNVLPFHGFLQTTTSNATSIINTSDIAATTGKMYWNFFVSSY